MKKETNKTIVLLSGGIDSACCVSYYLESGIDVRCLYINFGQNVAEREMKSAKAVSKHFDVPLDIINVDLCKGFGSGEVKGRNGTFIFLALMKYPNHTGLISIGIHDGVDYYDTKSSFIENMQCAVDEYTNGNVKIDAPFLSWSKKMVYEYSIARTFLLRLLIVVNLMGRLLVVNVLLVWIGKNFMKLARSVNFDIYNGDKVETPILLPSFSSKGFPQLRTLMQLLSDWISEPVLLSAYDLEYSRISKGINLPPQLLFIDSGGYECSSIVDFIDEEKDSYRPKNWNQRLYKKHVRAVLKKDIPKVIVSYDNPRLRQPLNNQIKLANKMFSEFDNTNKKFIREILIKPESKDEKRQSLPINKVIKTIKKFQPFRIIGFTEKELGTSLLERMANIAKVRQALAKSKMKQFIHIFGSLDPVSTPLYSMSGADIFDGLTWLRYAYYEGNAIYQRNYWAFKCSPNETD